MEQKSVKDRIEAWSEKAWPTSSHVSAEDCLKKAWGNFGQSGCSLVTFSEALKSLGFEPRLFDRVWILRLPGPSPKMAQSFLRCEGF